MSVPPRGTQLLHLPKAKPIGRGLGWMHLLAAEAARHIGLNRSAGSAAPPKRLFLRVPAEEFRPVLMPLAQD